MGLGMEVESGMIRALIVGIGINVHQTVSDLAGTDLISSAMIKAISRHS